MSGKQDKARRRAVESALHQQREALRGDVLTQVLTALYCLPLRQRVKWAWRVLRGYRRDSVCADKLVWTLDWALERVIRAINRFLDGSYSGHIDC